MEGSYAKQFTLSPEMADENGRLKLGSVLQMMQEVAGDHSALLGTDRRALEEKGLFWAVIRHRLQIDRLPEAEEEVGVITWPMPTTRAAYPRATEGYDKNGTRLFRAVSLWVLMDTQTRAMVLPKRSGVTVEGWETGCELEFPGSLPPAQLPIRKERRVAHEDLDINGHMNNCRYLDWMIDSIEPQIREKAPKELTACYLSEAREGEVLSLSWEVREDGTARFEALRSGTDSAAGHSRVFAAELRF